MRPDAAIDAARDIVSACVSEEPKKNRIFAEEYIDGQVVSVDRGIVLFREGSVGALRRLIATPSVASMLQRTLGPVALIVDRHDRIVSFAR